MNLVKSALHASRRARVRYNFTLACAMFAASMSGCANASSPNLGPPVFDTRVQLDPSLATASSEPVSEPARADWSDALQSLQSRDYARARDSFERFAAVYPLDPMAEPAVFMAVYAQIRANQLDSARARLRMLLNANPSADSRRHAWAYLALLERVERNARSARQLLERELGNDPAIHVKPGFVHEDDLSALASLLADTRIRGRQFEAALKDLEVVHTFDRSGQLKDWALASAITLAREGLDDATLERLLTSASSFQRATALTAYVPRQLERGNYPAATAAFQANATSLLAHEMEASFATLQNTLSVGGSEFSPIYGVALSLTGPDRRAGRAALGGMLLAQQSFDGKARMTDLWIEDTGGYEDGARSAVEKLCARGVPLILGPIEPALAPIAREEAAKCGAVYVGLDTVAGTDRSHLRMSFNANEEARLLVAVGRDSGASRWHIVTETPPAAYFEELESATRREVQQIGASVTGTSRVNIEDLQRSSRAIAQEIKRGNAQAIVFAVSSSTMTALSSYLAAEGVWPKTGTTNAAVWLGSSFAWGADVATNSARYVEGMYIASWLPRDRPATGFFYERFERTFGRAPGMLEAFSFDATQFARQVVLERGIRNGEALRGLLRAGFMMEGITGNWTFQNDSVSHPPTLQRVVSGELRTQ